MRRGVVRRVSVASTTNLFGRASARLLVVGYAPWFVAPASRASFACVVGCFFTRLFLSPITLTARSRMHFYVAAYFCDLY